MSRYAGFEARFDALQPRERTLASVAVGVLLALAVFVGWVEPAQNAAEERREQIATLEPQVASAREALDRVQQELARDPEAARRTMLEQLRGETARLDAELRADELAVIPPAAMPALLRELMGRDERLSVVGVEALPPEVLRWTPAAPVPPDATVPSGAAVPPDATGPAGAAPPGELPALYRHRVVLRFDGDYAATIDYLRAVETLPLRVRLDRLEVDAERWPRLRITLQVETLGLEEGWIGV